MKFKRKTHLASIALLTVAVAAGCAKKSKDDDDDDSDTAGVPTIGSGSGGSTLSSTEKSSEKAFGVVEDATDAIADGASTAASLADVSIQRDKACVKNDDGTVTVTVTFGGEGSSTVDREKATVAITSTASGSEVRTWTPPAGQTMDCQASDGPAKVRWKQEAAVEGLKLDVELDKTRSNDRVITPKAGGEARTATNSTSAKGTRSVEYSRLASDDAAVISLGKTITSSVTRTSTIAKAAGDPTVLSETVVVPEATPLVVHTDRQATDGALISKTIVSGTAVATDNTDSSRVESTFTAVKYDLSDSSANKCVPVSGSIAGKIFDAAGTETQSFVITFGADVDSGITIAYDGAEAAEYTDYSAKDCDLANE